MNMGNKSFNDLKGNLSEQDIDAIVSIVGRGCRDRAKARLRSILTYGAYTVPKRGALERLVKDKDLGWIYVAGQCYTSEIKKVREVILNGWPT